MLIRLTVILFFAAPVFAQGPPGGQPPLPDRVNTDRLRQQDMSRREWQLRNFGTEPGAPKDERQLKALMAQTEDDFNRILRRHNEIARALSSNNTLDYHFVSDATGEIQKRASRVQATLALRVSRSEEAQGANKAEELKDAEMKDALIKLCKEIRSFVTNPSIENPNTVDADQLTKARRDLESLIQLSGQIKKDADRLGHKKAQKAPNEL
jgi:rRNA maturation endonuclease Nob1